MIFCKKLIETKKSAVYNLVNCSLQVEPTLSKWKIDTLFLKNSLHQQRNILSLKYYKT